MKLHFKNKIEWWILKLVLYLYFIIVLEGLLKPFQALHFRFVSGFLKNTFGEVRAIILVLMIYVAITLILSYIKLTKGLSKEFNMYWIFLLILLIPNILLGLMVFSYNNLDLSLG